MSENVGDEIRKYLRILEGEYIPPQKRTLKVNIDHWDEFPRLMIRWHDPYYNYQTFDKGTMTFYDDVSYEEAKVKLAKLGIPFDELDAKTTTHRDNELQPDIEGQRSPYPSNRDIFDHET